MDKKQLKVAIVGAGLVGSLSALTFARRGYEVHLYEYRDDIRLTPQGKGRSINLSMSSRARAALRLVGLEDQMLAHAAPTDSRMIHAQGGALHAVPYDKKDHQSIHNLSRKFLSEKLIEAAEQLPNVHLHFKHKLVAANLETGRMTFRKLNEGDVLVEETANLIVGADGAFSEVRRQMMKQSMLDFSQTYIKHGYIELCIPATKTGQSALKENFVHIWPRDSFMMIALPNYDHSWSVTLYMTFEDFSSLHTPEKLFDFFIANFPDAFPLFGKARLGSDFFAVKPSPLFTIKCRPYHVGDKAIIIGDAAHAMVPFYGQGMNAGFEDVLVLYNLLSKHQDNLGLTLQEFSASRNKDAEAICDLALYNYVEIGEHVKRRSFYIRKKLDDFLFWLLPNTWVPLYCSVSFSDMRYHQCIENKRWQDKILRRLGLAAGAVSSVGLSALLYYYHKSTLHYVA